MASAASRLRGTAGCCAISRAALAGTARDASSTSSDVECVGDDGRQEERDRGPHHDRADGDKADRDERADDGETRALGRDGDRRGIEDRGAFVQLEA